MSKLKIVLIAMAAINLFLFLSGIVIPWVVSTDDLPLSGIIFLLSTILCSLITICLCISYKKVKHVQKKARKKKSELNATLSPEQKLESLFRKSLHTQLTEQEREELKNIVTKNGNMK